MTQAPPACCAATRRADRAGDTMHLVTPFPNIVFALDLTKPGAHVKWRFDPKADAGSRPFFNMLDGKTIALDAASGHDFWRTRSARVRRKLFTLVILAQWSATLVLPPCAY